MRDIALLFFFIIAIYYAFKRPYLGVAAWIWIALTAPAKWAYGFSNSLRLNLSIVAITCLAYLFVKHEGKIRINSIGILVFLFGLATLLSTVNNQSIVPEYVWTNWQQLLKILFLFFFVTMTITKRLHVDTVIWAIVLSISSYAAMEAVKFIISGGSYRIVGVSGIIADRNDLAVAINMCIPLLLYLIKVTKHKGLKKGLKVLVAMNILSIVGTYSRAGFIGLTILALAFYVKSNRKVLIGILAAIIIPVLLVNAPQEWKDRQSTVATASEKDGSFIGRLWAWKISILVANDNPYTGAGFGSTQMPNIWHFYAPSTQFYNFPVETGQIPEWVIPKAAHSIYFQVLGDHGYLGLLIFGLILWQSLMLNFKNKKLALAQNNEEYFHLSNNITLALVGFCVTGASVSLAYFDLFYALIGLVCAVNFQLKKRKSK
jgi:probable O-glycosylation ligase (exosortase A-associated)